MSAISVPTNSSPGTCFPSTTRHTVSGEAINNPSGPHSQDQNATDTTNVTMYHTYWNAVGSGGIGPITAQIKDRYFDIVRGKVPEYSHWVTPIY